MLQEALMLAVQYHADQFRDTNNPDCRIPYAVHPIEVMRKVWHWGVREPVVLSAAILHDTLEDTPVTRRDLEDKFGVEVAGLVDELSYDPDSDQTKQGYLEGFASASVPALTIKIADRLCNVRDFLVTHPGYAKKYFHKADVLFAAMKARLEEVAGRFDEDTKRRMVSDYEELCAELGSDKRPPGPTVPGGQPFIP